MEGKKGNHDMKEESKDKMAKGKEVAAVVSRNDAIPSSLTIFLYLPFQAIYGETSTVADKTYHDP